MWKTHPGTVQASYPTRCSLLFILRILSRFRKRDGVSTGPWRCLECIFCDILCLKDIFNVWLIYFMIGKDISCLENIFHVSSFVRKSSVVNFTWTDPHWRLLKCSIWEMSKIFISSNHPFLGPSFPSISHLVRHSSLVYEILRMKSLVWGFCSASWKTGADCVWRK